MARARFVSAAVLFVAVGCERAEPPARVDARAPLVAASSVALCGLLSAPEANALLEGSAKATPFEKMGYASSCVWEADNPRRGLIVTMSSPEQLRADESLRAADGDTPEKRFAQVVRSQAASGGSEPVLGLGDAALWTGKAGQLWILKKKRALVSVSFHGDRPRPDAREKSLAVARTILPRLGS